MGSKMGAAEAPKHQSVAGRGNKKPRLGGRCEVDEEEEERMMGLEPTTFCMASRRSSQLSYIRAGAKYSPAKAPTWRRRSRPCGLCPCGRLTSTFVSAPRRFRRRAGASRAI